MEGIDAMSVSDRLETMLTEARFRRRFPEEVTSTFDRLRARPNSSFVGFYEVFEGPFDSDRTGYILLDLFEQTPSIVTATETCRRRFGFHDQWLVISDLLANGTLIYDWKLDKVFDLTFEGGVDLLKRRELVPQWESFEDFLAEFFDVESGTYGSE